MPHDVIVPINQSAHVKEYNPRTALFDQIREFTQEVPTVEENYIFYVSTITFGRDGVVDKYNHVGDEQKVNNNM
jgi:hypothetical protein